MEGDDRRVDDLRILEDRIEQFLGYCRSLRAENKALRERIASLEEERGGLMQKMDAARTRLEALLAKLPEQ